MAVTQYIGARYVPLFYTNPDDGSNNWHSGVAYDPLTIVTDINQSYTSKIPVPATIGRPSENPTYWIMTGAYNAQVEQLITDVADITEAVDDLNDKNIEVPANRTFILIGDSFGVGVDGDNNSQIVSGGGWIQRCAGFIQAGGGTALYNTRGSGQMQGVTGFASSLPFLSILQAIKEDHVTDADAVTDIIVLGGTNDVSVAAAVPAAIATFLTYCRTNFPNAVVKIGAIGTNLNNLISTIEPVYKTCLQYGVEYISDLAALFFNLDLIGADGVHLKAAGYQTYAPYVMEAILTGHTDYKFSFQCAMTEAPACTMRADNPTIAFEYTPHSIALWMESSTSAPIFLPTTQPSAANTLSLAILARYPQFPGMYKKMYDAQVVKVKSDSSFVDNDGYIWFNPTVPDIRYTYAGSSVTGATGVIISYIPFKREQNIIMF